MRRQSINNSAIRTKPIHDDGYLLDGFLVLVNIFPPSTMHIGYAGASTQCQPNWISSTFFFQFRKNELAANEIIVQRLPGIVCVTVPICELFTNKQIWPTFEHCINSDMMLYLYSIVDVYFLNLFSGIRLFSCRLSVIGKFPFIKFVFKHLMLCGIK